jgi:hypothetical protein
MEFFLAPTLSVAGNYNGREDAIMKGKCLNHPIGCGRQLTMEEFATWPALEQREFQISGWCKECQDKVFIDYSELECCCVSPCSEVDVGVGVLTCATAHCSCDGSGNLDWFEAALEFLDRIYERDFNEYWKGENIGYGL